VDTRHASHAATGAIDASRPRAQQRFPAGSGISSFVACIREAITVGENQESIEY
tara:strand:- start:520 stop:681 length:162 start_codon:yes stop_codon:yes gene_type:complete